MRGEALKGGFPLKVARAEGWENQPSRGVGAAAGPGERDADGARKLSVVCHPFGPEDSAFNKCI